MLQPDECAEQYPIAFSPVATTSNRLLQGDLEKGEAGVIVRSIDIFDQPADAYKKVLRQVFGQTSSTKTKLQYLPASHLHGSMRVKNAIFMENYQNGVGILVGTKYKKNWSMKRYQQSDTNNIVDCTIYFPTDAGTLSRGILENATACRATTPLCVEKECLAKEDSACGGCKVVPQNMGDLVARWHEKEKIRTVNALTYEMCHYDNAQDMVTASNSLWMEQRRWFAGDSSEYPGYSECTATINIEDHNSVADALVVPMRPSFMRFDQHQNSTMCDYGSTVEIGKSLVEAWKLGFGNLPVLIYRELKGLRNIEECHRLWGGKNCNNGWRKEFISQEYQFDDHACIHRPPGCHEAYYFPPDHDECSAFTEAGKSRIDELCANESHMDAIFAATDNPSSSPFAPDTPKLASFRKVPLHDDPQDSTSSDVASSFLFVSFVLSLFLLKRILKRVQVQFSIGNNTLIRF